MAQCACDMQCSSASQAARLLRFLRLNNLYYLTWRPEQRTNASLYSCVCAKCELLLITISVKLLKDIDTERTQHVSLSYVLVLQALSCYYVTPTRPNLSIGQLLFTFRFFFSSFFLTFTLQKTSQNLLGPIAWLASNGTDRSTYQHNLASGYNSDKRPTKLDTDVRKHMIQ